MNNIPLKRLALNAALLVGGVAAAVTLSLAIIYNSPLGWVITIGSSLSAAILTYFIFLYYVKNFISNRIRALYKIIYNLKLDDTETLNIPEGSDELLVKMQREVSEWVKNRSSEIEDLRKLEHYRREFLSNVSHELKTPVFNIQGYISTLLDGGMEDETINRNYLQRTEKSVERMIHIIEDLESISRLESGELILDQHNFDIAGLVKDIYDAEEMIASSKNIRLKFRENYKPITVFGDKELIRQVLTNLIVNSIKYGKESGESETRFYDMDDHILVEISDNGIGIAKEHLPRLFERFYRVDKGRSREQGGTGLGLAIVKHILEAHGQTVNVRSSEGVGSTFSFTLPKGK